MSKVKTFWLFLCKKKKKVFVLAWNCRDVWTEFLTASLLSLNKILKLIFMFYNSRAVVHLYCLVSL